MAYNAHISINPLNMVHLPFLKRKVVHLFEEGNEVWAGILFTMSEEDYAKAAVRLKGNQEHVITSGDVVFIMPGSKIPHFKLKDHIKKVGARVTYYISEATVFIGTDRIEETNRRDRKPGSLLWNTDFSKWPIEQDIALALAGSRQMNDYKSMKSDLGDYLIIAENEIVADNDLACNENRDSVYFITPAGAEIIFNSILKKAPIISEDLVEKQITPSVVIDEEVYKSLDLMLKSTDGKDQLTASEIIANCDINKSLFYLWKLANTHGKKLRNSRFKNIRNFVAKSSWLELQGMDENSIIDHLLNNGVLTEEYFSELITGASNNHKPYIDDSTFDIVVTMTPRAKYKDYVPDNLKFTFEFKASDNADQDNEEIEEPE